MLFQKIVTVLVGAIEENKRHILQQLNPLTITSATVADRPTRSRKQCFKF